MKNIILAPIDVGLIFSLAWMTMILLIIVIPFAAIMLKKWFENNK